MEKKLYNFTDGWVSGFTQSDGCFTTAFDKRDSGLMLRPKPIFLLVQDISELDMFKKLHHHLGVGYLTTNKTTVSLYVTNLRDISQVLFPLFEKHPLKYGKLNTYLVFKHIVNMMLKKEHLKLEGLLTIIEASFLMNIETGRRTADSKQKLIEFLRDKHGLLPPVEWSSISIEIEKSNFKREGLTLDFIAGLIDGDGSFNVSFQHKPTRRVRVNFTVIQETACKEVLNELKTYLGCGNVYDLPSAASRYQVENVDLILNQIAPILNKVTFNTQKGEHYKTIIKVSEIIKSKGYKSDADFINIIELAYDSNKLGKRRKFTKEEFIARLNS